MHSRVEGTGAPSADNLFLSFCYWPKATNLPDTPASGVCKPGPAANPAGHLRVHPEVQDNEGKQAPTGLSVPLEDDGCWTRAKPENFSEKRGCRGFGGRIYFGGWCRGRSSGVERHVANVNVVSSNLIARCRSNPKDGNFHTPCCVEEPMIVPTRYRPGGGLALVVGMQEPRLVRGGKVHLARGKEASRAFFVW
jgi:hypothetical protein